MKKAFHFDHATHFFAGESEVHKISGYEDYILPAFATWIEPQAFSESEQFDVNQEKWIIEKKPVEVIAYNKETKAEQKFDDASLVTDDYTLEEPPSKYHIFDNELDQWIMTRESENKKLIDSEKTWTSQEINQEKENLFLHDIEHGNKQGEHAQVKQYLCELIDYGLALKAANFVRMALPQRPVKPY